MKAAIRCFTMLICVYFAGLAVAQTDVVLEWNAIATNTAVANGQNPFAQARTTAIVQLAVFEAVNATDNRYRPYLGITAPQGASAEAAAITAAHRVLVTFFPGSASALDAARTSSLASIANGQAKTDGMAVGEAAAGAIMLLRANDGSAPPQFKTPGAVVPGEWQATPSCPSVNGTAVGTFLHWPNVRPFGIHSTQDYLLPPPPQLTSQEFAMGYNEVMTVGSASSSERPPDRADVVRYYQMSSPSYVLNHVARQVAEAQHRSLSHNARSLALLNMAVSDSLVASMYNKYHYNFWRPETAIRAGDTDGNRKTDADLTYVPFIATPCFPSYPSNHASGTSGGAEILRRLYGASGHSITLSNPAVPGVTLHYTSFKQIMDDVDDARVFGGIHYRFDQDAGGKLGRSVATEVYSNNLRRTHATETEAEE